MLLLPNSMFDDGSIEARNFTVIQAHEDAGEFADYYEWAGIQKYYPEHVNSILEAFKAGKHHFTTILVDKDITLEFQWD